MTDPAFKIVPKGSPCFLVWRIENFKPVAIPKDEHGSFYDGDAYIVLCQKDVRGRLEQDIHFWLGRDSSQDEQGTAAIKSVELDDLLGGAPIQHRECQNNESKQFLSYFKNTGVRYLQGGVASGFSHVEHVIRPRLLSVKGKHTVKMEEKHKISWSEMNPGDVFILDIGEILYVWNGSSCSRTERVKALEMARGIRDDRGDGNIVIVEDGEESVAVMGDGEFKMFSEYLPLSSKRSMKTAAEGGNDEMFEKKKTGQLRLWKVAEECGALQVTDRATAPLHKNMLDTNDCFIVDNGEDGIWSWIGRKASSAERKGAITNAMAFIKQRSYSVFTKVTKIPEGGESSEFKALFKTWENPQVPGSGNVHGANRIARTVQTKFDAATLHSNPEVARDTGMVDDGSGTKKIWRIENMAIVELDKSYHGEMYGGDSYIIHYMYNVSGRDEHILYYWLGRHSTTDERGTAAAKTVEIDDSLGGAAKQVRVVQGKEPNHFMACFGGRLIIFQGGKAGWGGHTSDGGPGDTYLLHVRGTNQYNTKAEQVACVAESLNSNDVFVLFSKKSTYVWAGKGCTGDERELAKEVASKSASGHTMLLEGQENEEFWTLLGGKADYSSDNRLTTPENEARRSRLFQCSNASGVFKAEEIMDFVQEDLVPDDVFILDADQTIYVWLGREARNDEKQMSMDTAIEFLETDPSGRDAGTPIMTVKQGYEPPDFVGHFGVWDRELWSQGKTYAELKKELGAKNISMEQILQKSKQKGETSFSDSVKFPLEILLQTEELPEGVDTARKEKHLTLVDFEKVFGVSYEVFITLPGWKQAQRKKDAGLF